MSVLTLHIDFYCVVYSFSKTTVPLFYFADYVMKVFYFIRTFRVKYLCIIKNVFLHRLGCLSLVREALLNILCVSTRERYVCVFVNGERKENDLDVIQQST